MLTIFGRSSVVNPIKMFLAFQLHSSYTYFVLEADQTSFNRVEVQLKGNLPKIALKYLS